MTRAPLPAYAEAYVLALPANTEAVLELGRLIKALAGVRGLRGYVAETSVSPKDRAKALKIANPALHGETINLALLLAEHRALSRVERLVPLVREAYARKTKSVIASVASAVPLNDAERERLVSVLSHRSGSKHVRLEETIDPNLLGGLRVRLGDWEFDATVAGRLRRMTHALTTV